MQYRSYYQFTNKLLSAFTHMSCDSYRTRFRSLLLCPLSVMFVESYIIIMISSTCFLILFRYKWTCNVKRESELHAFDMRFTLTCPSYRLPGSTIGVYVRVFVVIVLVVLLVLLLWWLLLFCCCRFFAIRHADALLGALRYA